MAAQPEPDDLRTVSYLPTIHRMLPNDQGAESGVLCSFLINPRHVGQICIEKGITPEHFYVHAHGLIYAVLKEFWQENEPIDLITITGHMRNAGTLDNAGGAAFITELSGYVETAANVTSYLETVVEMFIFREVIKISTATVSDAYEHQDDVPGLLGKAVDGLMKIVRIQEGHRRRERTMRQLAMDAAARMDARLSLDWTIKMPTGIKALDRACLGFKPNTVTMLMGKPSDGKSSLALNIAEYLAMVCGFRVGIISLDDSDDEVMDRLIQQRAKVNLFAIENSGIITPEEAERFQRTTIELGNADDRIFIRDDGALSPAEISATLASWQTKHGLDFVVIDHIQLARGDGTTRGGTEEANQVSRSLKPMAKRFGIPLLVLSQTTETTTGFKTKNTTSLQEDANRLWFITHPTKAQIDGGMNPEHVWINVGKQKNGPKGDVPVRFVKEWTRFMDRDTEPEPDQLDLVQMPPGKRPNRRK